MINVEKCEPCQYHMILKGIIVRVFKETPEISKKWASNPVEIRAKPMNSQQKQKTQYK